VRFLLAVIVVLTLILLLVCGLGIGIGFLLHWLFPAIDLGMAVLIGVVASGWAIHFFVRLYNTVDTIMEHERDSELDEVVVKPLRARYRARRSRR